VLLNAPHVWPAESSSWLQALNESGELHKRSIYPTLLNWRFNREDVYELSQFKAVVFMTYFPVCSNFIELYRMNVPIFVPSYRMWNVTHRWSFNQMQMASIVPPPPDMACLGNPTQNLDHFGKTWDQLTDYALFPFVQTFDSWEDLADKIIASNFTRIREQMDRENELQTPIAEVFWRRNLEKLLHASLRGNVTSPS
jgi:hypothetical protein